MVRSRRGLLIIGGALLTLTSWMFIDHRSAEPMIAASPSPARQSFARLPPNRPTKLIIPGHGIEAPIVPLGRQPNGMVEVPALGEANRVGWYANGPVPGDPGPAVILGHRDANGTGGALLYANEMRAGQNIDIERADGMIVHFVVTSIELFDKQQFPTARVYVQAQGPELRLVTCGGAFDHSTRSYAANLIVFARADMHSRS